MNFAAASDISECRSVDIRGRRLGGFIRNDRYGLNDVQREKQSEDGQRKSNHGIAPSGLAGRIENRGDALYPGGHFSHAHQRI